MDFSLTEDQEALRSSVRDFLEKECTPEVLRSSFESEDGFHAGLWEKVAGLGWQGLTIPEEHGGIGLGWVEAAILAEEMGRRLFCGPYFSTTVAAAAVVAAGDDDQKKAYLPSIADGSLIATPALFEGRSLEGSPMQTKARVVGDGWVLEGVKSYVCDASVAGLLLVTAIDDAAEEVFLVEADAPGVAIEEIEVADGRRQGTVVLDGAESAHKLASGAFETIQQRASLFLAGEQTGIARRCLEMAIEHANNRHQFGKPIGTYQAVSHRIADMFLYAEHAASLLYYAAWAADHEPAQSAPAAWEAMLWASQAARRAALDSIQIHGGIGFTWEHDLHLYLKRAKANQTLFGDESVLLDRISQARHGA